MMQTALTVCPRCESPLYQIYRDEEPMCRICGWRDWLALVDEAPLHKLRDDTKGVTAWDRNKFPSQDSYYRGMEVHTWRSVIWWGRSLPTPYLCQWIECRRKQTAARGKHDCGEHGNLGCGNVANCRWLCRYHASIYVEHFGAMPRWSDMSLWQYSGYVEIDYFRRSKRSKRIDMQAIRLPMGLAGTYLTRHRGGRARVIARQLSRRFRRETGLAGLPVTMITDMIGGAVD